MANNDLLAKERIADIDREIILLALERCELLKKSQANVEIATSFGSLRQTQVAVGTETGCVELATHDHEFARRLKTFVSGLTYQHAIHADSIAYLGPEHSYSHIAACKFFGAIPGMQPVNSIGAVFEEILKQQSKYGVVPIENSTDGRIVDTLNMFIRMPAKICGEILLPIHHNLLARCARQEIETVYSKPQALSQCRSWLTQHLPQARWVEVASTAVAAQIACDEAGAAAVASKEAGIHLGLDLIAESIEDNPNNLTRFVVLGQEMPTPSGNDKTALMFQVPHKPGALADVMVMFRNNGLNLTWIESFPVPGVANEYYFFVELEGHAQQANVQMSIETLKQTALRLEFLGSYPRGTM